MTRLTVALEYFHAWPNSAGLYLARARGWYAEAGIDLELRTVDHHRGDALEHLLRGDVDLGIFPSNRLLVRRAAGQPLIGLAAINQRGLETLRTRADSGIERLRDLQGRRIAFNPTPRGVAVVRALIAGDGGDPDDYVAVDAGVRELDPANGFDGIADATFGSYWAWDNLLTSLPPEAERSWRVDDALGLRYHSYLLGSRQDHPAPALVEDFLAVTARGYVAAAAEQDAAAALYDGITPWFPPAVIRRSLAEISTTWFHEGEWGIIREELVAPYSEWLRSNGILDDADAWRSAVPGARVALGT